MTYQIKMMNNDTFDISEVTYRKLEGKTGLIHLKEIDVIINLNSVASIVPETMTRKDRMKLHDGSYAIRKFGKWYSEHNPEAVIDLAYYPELISGEDNRSTGDKFAYGAFVKLPSNGLEPVEFKHSSQFKK